MPETKRRPSHSSGLEQEARILISDAEEGGSFNSQFALRFIRFAGRPNYLASGCLVILVVVLALLFGDAPVLAQCAMCRTAVEGAANVPALSHTLNLAILVLLLPSVAIMTGAFIVAIRYRNL